MFQTILVIILVTFAVAWIARRTWRQLTGRHEFPSCPGCGGGCTPSDNKSSKSKQTTLTIHGK